MAGRAVAGVEEGALAAAALAGEGAVGAAGVAASAEEGRRDHGSARFQTPFSPPWRLRSAFPRSTLDTIEAAIKASETHHSGELRFAIETTLPALDVMRGMSSRHRAIEVFSQMRVWDTEENSGVLIYVLLAEHGLEIVADRGLARRVEQGEWDAIARDMKASYARGQFVEGSIAGIDAITRLLKRHFPPGASNPNELPDRPTILRR